MGSFYRSRHELIFAFKNGTAPHVNSFELGQHGRYRTNVWSYKGMNSFGGQRNEEIAPPSDGEARGAAGRRDQGRLEPRRDRARPLRRLGLDADRRPQDRAAWPPDGTRSRSTATASSGAGRPLPRTMPSSRPPARRSPRWTRERREPSCTEVPARRLIPAPSPDPSRATSHARPLPTTIIQETIDMADIIERPSERRRGQAQLQGGLRQAAQGPPASSPASPATPRAGARTRATSRPSSARSSRQGDPHVDGKRRTMTKVQLVATQLVNRRSRVI